MFRDPDNPTTRGWATHAAVAAGIASTYISSENTIKCAIDLYKNYLASNPQQAIGDLIAVGGGIPATLLFAYLTKDAAIESAKHIKYFIKTHRL